MTNIIKNLWYKLPIELRGQIGKKTRSILAPIQKQTLLRKINKYPQKGNGVCLVGFFSASIGHGIATKLLYSELVKSGISVRKIDISEIQQAPIDKDTKIIIENAHDDDTIIFVIHPDLLIYTLNNLNKNLIKNKKLIGYWVWELDIAPKNWEIAKGLVHEIWTPSEFSKSALEKMFGCPIKVLAHPSAIEKIENLPFETRKIWRDKFEINNDDFVVFQSFSFSSSMARKNIFGAIKAFEMAFEKDKSTVFVIRYSGEKHFPDALIRLKNRVAQSNANIKLVKAGGDFNEVLQAYSGADCYISLHRSEGFGLNLAESMLYGLPLICTNWSGNVDFMNDKTCALIDAKLIDVYDEDGVYSQKGAKWADADIVQASQALQKIRNDEKYRNSLINNAKKYAMEKLSGIDLKDWI